MSVARAFIYLLVFNTVLCVTACGDDNKKNSASGSGQTATRAIPLIPLAGVRPGGGGLVDRSSEVKRALETYQSTAVRFLDSLARAESADERAQLASKAPTPAVMAMILGQVVAEDPADESGFDALAVLARYASVPSVDAALERLLEAKPRPGAKPPKVTEKIDALGLLLKHHISNPKLAEVVENLKDSADAEQFLIEVFNNTSSVDVRGRAGVVLARKALATDAEEIGLGILSSLADDRYMDGVKLGASSSRSVREWAAGQVLELTKLVVGKPLPEVVGENLDGQRASLTDYRGKVLVLDVWTTWCGPCVAMIPHEREMVERLKDKPFALLSVSCDEEKSTLTDFLKAKNMPWHHWWVGRNEEFSKALNIRAYPTIYVLDREGVIRFKNIRGEELEKAVNSLLAESQ